MGKSNLRKDPAYPGEFDPFGSRPVPQSPWRPMSEFDPSKHCILHDELNEIEIEWSGEDPDAWHKYAVKHTESVMNWGGYLIDRWRELTKQ